MFASIAGLPAHPLLVHLSVVAAPVGALLLLLWATAPRWRARLGTFTVGVSAVAFAASLLAKSTGEALLPAMGLSEHAPGQVGPHAQYADLLVVAVGLCLGISVLLYAAQRWLTAVRFARRDTVLLALRVLAVLAAVFSLVMVALTGHAGAQLVWGNFPG
ncbi:DUF2231 domain-containing protein [Kocuria sp. APC 4018]|uniref:DUF2231 domain-containing protein n=1 Tax=Kocuria sp. APC 4018 TaxID=3035196 RepID=UPI0025B3A566|nr:DUF2231 domain-containing protein [Kocuria sp. APC 4018]MDN3461582.1 hypothetical protein [Kocuria sp. APC 4018]